MDKASEGNSVGDHGGSGFRHAGLLGLSVLLGLVCGCGGGSQEPVAVSFEQVGDGKVFKVTQFIAPAGFASSKQVVPGTYTVKGTYDVTSLEPVQQEDAVLKLSIMASIEGDPATKDADRIIISKDRLKGDFELKIGFKKVINPLGSKVDVAYLVQGAVQFSTVELKVK